MFALRILLSTPIAALITLGLFYFMQALISTGDLIEENLTVVRLIDATMPEFNQEVIEEIEKPEPIEELMEQQPEDPLRDVNISSGPSLNIARMDVSTSSVMQIEQTSISAADGDYLPLVRVPPQYPNRALQRGIEGWCLVEFTVNARGGVVEESIVVVDGEPQGVFDRTSMRAVAGFKYQPRVKDGVGVDVPNVQTILRYNIADN